ncbi:MAG: hypothetical protein EAX91_01965 [Candidatus Lokiarchaeota archaeon]|nr:hypothetical protein [Candidatus Lokiarchaeota archaeon]
MIEKEPFSEKQADEKLRSEIKEEIKREMREEQRVKSGKSRKTAGVIISGVGAILYLIFGFFLLILGSGMGIMRNIAIMMLIAGGISITGVIVAMYKVKIGGIITLISIPIAIVIGIILQFTELHYYYYYYWLYLLEYMLAYTPYAYLHVIPGGIICLTANDMEEISR